MNEDTKQKEAHHSGSEFAANIHWESPKDLALLSPVKKKMRKPQDDDDLHWGC
jgi:hypothetical protein